ncbi:hypothetical protein, partial [uncultured Maritalea sp.]
MIKTFSPINIFLLLIILAIFVFGLVTIPADQLVAVHWNINGEVDFELPANLALWIGPLECLVVILGVYFAHKNMPTEEFAAAKSLLEASVSIAFGAGLLVQSVITLSASGYVLDVPQIATIFIGFVMLILG